MSEILAKALDSVDTRCDDLLLGLQKGTLDSLLWEQSSFELLRHDALISSGKASEGEPEVMIGKSKRRVAEYIKANIAESEKRILRDAIEAADSVDARGKKSLSQQIDICGKVLEEAIPKLSNMIVERKKLYMSATDCESLAHNVTEEHYKSVRRYFDRTMKQMSSIKDNLREGYMEHERESLGKVYEDMVQIRDALIGEPVAGAGEGGAEADSADEEESVLGTGEISRQRLDKELSIHKKSRAQIKGGARDSFIKHKKAEKKQQLSHKETERQDLMDQGFSIRQAFTNRLPQMLFDNATARQDIEEDWLVTRGVLCTEKGRIMRRLEESMQQKLGYAEQQYLDAVERLSQHREALDLVRARLELDLKRIQHLSGTPVHTQNRLRDRQLHGAGASPYEVKLGDGLKLLATHALTPQQELVKALERIVTESALGGTKERRYEREAERVNGKLRQLIEEGEARAELRRERRRLLLVGKSDSDTSTSSKQRKSTGKHFASNTVKLGTATAERPSTSRLNVTSLSNRAIRVGGSRRETVTSLHTRVATADAAQAERQFIDQQRLDKEKKAALLAKKGVKGSALNVKF